MRSNERLQRLLEIRQLGGRKGAAAACAMVDATWTLTSDLRLFALTFVAGFLFTSIFLA